MFLWQLESSKFPVNIKIVRKKIHLFGVNYGWWLNLSMDVKDYDPPSIVREKEEADVEVERERRSVIDAGRKRGIRFWIF